MGLMRSTAYFFGTFNPIHLGHLLMAELAREQFDLETVVFVPAWVPPHRPQDEQMIAYEHRLAMVRLACEDNSGLKVSDIESRLSAPSYTINTLEALISDFGQPDTPKIPLIIGADALNTLPTWHQAERLISGCFFLHAPRLCPVTPGQEETLSSLMLRDIAMPYIGISASEIRTRLSQGHSIRYQVPASVEQYLNHYVGLTPATKTCS